MARNLIERACRKCGVPNPPGNEYCRKCGAVLYVSTAQIKAQPSPVLPVVRGIRWRWVAVAVPLMLGVASILITMVLTVVYFMFGELITTQLRDLGGITADFIGLSIALATSLLVAFGFGGLSVAWLVRERLVIEPAIASFIVLALLGAMGSTISIDILLITGVLVVPSAALAGLGGRLGELFAQTGKKS